MGQKTNPNILRLGINKTWKTKFFEKKRQELPLYTFKDLETKEYIERFLTMRGIFLHDYKQHYTNSTLNLYISYFIASEFSLKKNTVPELTIINKDGIKKKIGDCVTLNDSRDINSVSLVNKDISVSDFYELQKYFKLNQQNELEFSYASKSHIKSIKPLYKGNQTDVTFKELFQVLNLFTKNKFDIVINFCCVNKDINFLKFSQIKKFSSLQKYRNASFLKEGFELLFHVVHNRNSANLLATFIAFQIKKIKRQKFFTSFLKQALTVLIKSELSKVRGVKILIKGRLNGVPRAKHKIIAVGDVPAQSIGAILDYAQKTTHNSNGSYGIKVWVVET